MCDTCSLRTFYELLSLLRLPLRRIYYWSNENDELWRIMDFIPFSLRRHWCVHRLPLKLQKTQLPWAHLITHSLFRRVIMELVRQRRLPCEPSKSLNRFERGYLSSRCLIPRIFWFCCVLAGSRIGNLCNETEGLKPATDGIAWDT